MVAIESADSFPSRYTIGGDRSTARNSIDRFGLKIELGFRQGAGSFPCIERSSPTQPDWPDGFTFLKKFKVPCLLAHHLMFSSR
jgi:hypothetical protein